MCKYIYYFCVSILLVSNNIRKGYESPKIFQFSTQKKYDIDEEENISEVQNLHELSLNLKNHLNSLKCIKKNFSRYNFHQ